MTYTPFHAAWHDFPATDTPITAAAMQHVEDGIDDAHTAIDDHLADTTDAHDATAISYAGSTNLSATTVEAALDELDTEKQPLDSDLTAIAGLGVTNDSVIQGKSGAWAKQTMAQLATDIEASNPPWPLGPIARGERATTNTTTAATVKKFMEIQAPLIAGRLYRISAHCHIFASTGPTGAQLMTRYTVDGSTPGIGSTQLGFSYNALPTANVDAEFTPVAFYTPGSNVTFRVVITYNGFGGGPTYTCRGFPATLVIEDMGVDPGDSGTDF